MKLLKWLVWANKKHELEAQLKEYCALEFPESEAEWALKRFMAEQKSAYFA
jgi:hypothetical protein